jgi:hypothetical protein
LGLKAKTSEPRGDTCESCSEESSQRSRDDRLQPSLSSHSSLSEDAGEVGADGSNISDC